MATMQSNQKYFPLVGTDGRLMAKFITVANIATPEPAVVREGNERVIRPRFSGVPIIIDFIMTPIVVVILLIHDGVFGCFSLCTVK